MYKKFALAFAVFAVVAVVLGGAIGATVKPSFQDFANGLTETGGPTDLSMGVMADGKFLKRSGTNLVGASAGEMVLIQTITGQTGATITFSGLSTSDTQYTLITKISLDDELILIPNNNSSPANWSMWTRLEIDLTTLVFNIDDKGTLSDFAASWWTGNGSDGTIRTNLTLSSGGFWQSDSDTVVYGTTGNFHLTRIKTTGVYNDGTGLSSLVVKKKSCGNFNSADSFSLYKISK